MNTALFAGDILSLARLEDGLAELRFDRRGSAVNTLDPDFFAELGGALDVLAAQRDLRGLLVSSAKDGFLAGADLAVLRAMSGWSAEQLRAFCSTLTGVLARLDDQPFPVVCAINGAALGGGLETALAADYRVLAANAPVGFPEAGLGILPAAGGTVRTPRLTSHATALEWLCGGRSYPADAALKAGMVDAIADPAQLRDTALDWLRRAAAGALDWPARRARRSGRFTPDEAALAATRERFGRTARHYPAALAIAELLSAAAPLSRDAAFAPEAETFVTLMRSPTAASLVTIALSTQQLRKRSRALGAQGRAIRQAAVLGAGIMGGGVAYTSAVRGIPVLLKDIQQSQLDLGMGEARKLLVKQVEAGKLSAAQAGQILGSIEPTLSFDGIGRAAIIVEAVVEKLEVKQAVFAEVERLVPPGTVLASNTSSLAIAEIAAPLARPEDVVGMHFFNPVHLMPLVEVIRGPRSSERAVATTVAYAASMGKVPLVVKDCPGFLINRILGAYFSAFLLLIRDGADFVHIDQVMERWGWPMGPAYLLDVAGIDTLDKAMAILGRAYPAVMAAGYPTAIGILASEKRYGQKTGAGFFRYEADAKGRPRRSDDPAVAELLARGQPDGARHFGDEEILDRMMLAMILEAGRCLDEQVADGAVEIDAGMRLGTGFPAHHGGPLWYADSLGAAEVLRRCERHAALGGLYRPGTGLRERAATARRYYAPVSG